MRRVRGSPLLCLVAGAISLTAACSKLLGVDSYSVSGAPRPEGGVSAKAGDTFHFVDPRCDACMNGSCGAELAVCGNDTLCGPWQECISKCQTGDTVCQHGCFATAGSTNAALADAAICAAEYCLDTCKVLGGAAAPAASCADAALAKCGAEARTCFGDATCRDYWRCLTSNDCVMLTDERSTAGVNPACEWQCADRYGPYLPVLEADGGLQRSAMARFNLCLYGGAYPACSLGDLSCVGKYSSPPSSTNEILVQFYVTVGLFPEAPGSAIGGVAIRACPALSDCAEDSGHDTTDDRGHATITIPAIDLGVDWYFAVTPPASWPNGPEQLLFYSGRHLTQPTTLSIPLDQADFADLSKLGANARLRDDWNPDKAALFVVVRTCYNSVADGLEIRLTTLDGTIAGTPAYGGTSDRPCDISCGSTATTNAYFSGIEPGIVRISAYDAGAKVAEEVVLTKRDSVTILNWLEPLRSP